MSGQTEESSYNDEDADFVACHVCGYIRCDCRERVLIEVRDAWGLRLRWRDIDEDW